MKDFKHEGHAVRAAKHGGTPVRDGEVHKGEGVFLLKSLNLRDLCAISTRLNASLCGEKVFTQ